MFVPSDILQLKCHSCFSWHTSWRLLITHFLCPLSW